MTVRFLLTQNFEICRFTLIYRYVFMVLRIQNLQHYKNVIFDFGKTLKKYRVEHTFRKTRRHIKKSSKNYIRAAFTLSKLP